MWLLGIHPGVERVVPKDAGKILSEVYHRNKHMNSPKDGQIQTPEENNSIIKDKTLSLVCAGQGCKMESIRLQCQVPITL